MNFAQKCERAFEKGSLCVGLDPTKIPPCLGGQNPALGFIQGIVEATAKSAAFYKPNLAFYRALSSNASSTLESAVRTIRGCAPGTVIIGDAKYGDVFDTSVAHVTSLKRYGFDAITVNPYIGAVTPVGAKPFGLQPFLENSEVGAFVLCLTSNPEAAEFQKQLLFKKVSELAPLLEKLEFLPSVICDDLGWKYISCEDAYLVPLYQYVAISVAAGWNGNRNVGLVVGGTHPPELDAVRFLVGGDMPILMPGFGKQGGALKEALAAGMNSCGTGAIVNVSSAITGAWEKENDPAEFKDLARQVAEQYAIDINTARAEILSERANK